GRVDAGGSGADDREAQLGQVESFVGGAFRDSKSRSSLSKPGERPFRTTASEAPRRNGRTCPERALRGSVGAFDDGLGETGEGLLDGALGQRLKRIHRIAGPAARLLEGLLRDRMRAQLRDRGRELRL